MSAAGESLNGLGMFLRISFSYYYYFLGRAFRDCLVQLLYVTDLFHEKRLALVFVDKRHQAVLHMMCTTLLRTKIVVEYMFLDQGGIQWMRCYSSRCHLQNVSVSNKMKSAKKFWHSGFASACEYYNSNFFMFIFERPIQITQFPIHLV